MITVEPIDGNRSKMCTVCHSEKDVHRITIGDECRTWQQSLCIRCVDQLAGECVTATRKFVTEHVSFLTSDQ